ncbi:MAG: VanZ family protein [Betaproteobacteria bacterium]|nr:VanZ family protein [Betaproteobacteria bacterium]
MKESPARPVSPSSPLLRYLTLAYFALIVYASLHPFSGWRDKGIPFFAFLTNTHWPRWWTGFDFGINIAAYLPLGFLCALWFRERLGRGFGALAAVAFCVLLSMSMEATQTLLPTRVSSNLDFWTNALGGLIGAVLALFFGAWLFEKTIQWQRRLIAPLPNVEFGLTLLGLWLLAQLSPEILLFGTGDVQPLFSASPLLQDAEADLAAAASPLIPFAAHRFFMLETAITALNTIAIGLFVRTLLSERIGAKTLFPVMFFFFLAALLIRTLAAAVLVGPAESLAWLTPGAICGLIAGLLPLFALLRLSVPWSLIVAGLALILATALVNLIPENPYSAAALLTWRQGHFLNFNGLTRFVARFWPFFALPCFALLCWRRRS